MLAVRENHRRRLHLLVGVEVLDVLVLLSPLVVQVPLTVVVHGLHVMLVVAEGLSRGLCLS